MKKVAYIDAAAVCGNTVVAYSSDPKIDASFHGNQIPRRSSVKNGYKVTVKIFTDLRPFLERLDSMNDHRESLEEGIKFTPDEKYPDLSRNELIRHDHSGIVSVVAGIQLTKYIYSNVLFRSLV